MDERKIQKDYVMNFLCRREDEGGLGYRQVAPNVVNNGMFIPSVLAEFLQKSQPAEWDRLMRKFGGDEKSLQNRLVETIREKVVDRQNAAIFFNTSKTFSFEGESLTLFYVPNTELNGDEDFRKNIFCAVEESSYKSQYNGTDITSVRPDVTFYLNGIFLGYMELKSVIMGQNARDHGRGKVAKDYLSAVRALTTLEQTDPKAAKEKKALLAIYEKAIHITASDINETYVLRNTAQLYDAAHAEFTAHPSTSTIDQLVPEVKKSFKLYPVSSPLLTEKERFEETARALYSKEAIKNEILYFNFISYKYKYDKSLRTRTRTSNSGHLIAPRPKQKFGCDKIMGRIREMLDNEDNPNYYNDKLRCELYALHIPQQKVEEIIVRREGYCNNKFVYSLLMQYAAGFGKSNIIGWTALMLKDYRFKGAYAYDKIMLVVDRLQLRGQLDECMYNMNIDKSMFVEAKDKQTFIDALSDNRRIIVVNIQKFLDLQKAIDESGTILKKMRVAFLIDEIHRSNSGENNKEMINLFERLQDSFKERGKTIDKKNLLIGFTATPSDETLSRFGEFRSATTVPMWVPFDTYTMKEAIEDGYILDPTKHIIPYNVPVGFELPDGLKGDKDGNMPDVKIVKQRVYESEPRMRKIAAFVVDRLVSLVYGKIRGEGKAMLAVSSIPIAIKYTRLIRELFAEKCRENRYVKYADAPISVVYSDNQRNEPSASLNYGVGEEQVIENFKSAKNGLIIVVDKLQTGFDENKLHTLFLDKEIKDINAIQTISRVDRTCKYKKECHVIDCSWQNVNTANINEAFKKYCDMAVSCFNPEEEVKSIGDIHKQMTASDIYKKWFKQYTQQKEDDSFVLNMAGDIRNWVEACFAREAAVRQKNDNQGLKDGDAGYVDPIKGNAARMLRFIVGRYASSIMSLKNVYDIAEKYTDETFFSFWQIFCRIYREVTRDKKEPGYSFEVTDSDEIAGITDGGDEETDHGGGGGGGPKEPTEKKPKLKSMEQLLDTLRRLNEQEKIGAQVAQMWLKEIGLMFDWLRKKEKLCALLRDDRTQEEEKLKEYKKQLGIYKLVELKKRTDFVKADRFKQMLDDNEEQFFAIFMEQLKYVENGEADFDYDTTGETEPAPENMTMDDLLELARKKLRPDYNEVALKERMCAVYAPHFEKIAGMIRPMKEVMDNLFGVLNTESLPHLDGMDSIVKDSLNILNMAEGVSATEKRIHLCQLLMKYEVFLKKLYYLINNREVQNRDPGMTATLSSCIFGIESLRILKHCSDPNMQEFSDRLKKLRRLRNSEAHGGFNTSEQEVNAAIDIVVDMYLYAVGTNITGLEMAGFDMEPCDSTIQLSSKKLYTIDETPSENVYGDEGLQIAATSMTVEGLDERTRLEILKGCLTKLVNYGYNKKGAVFCKQRHWVAVYRIAADYGFVIDGDYDYFKKVIDEMHIANLPYELSAAALQNSNNGVYAQHISDWNDEGLEGKALTEYVDIRRCAQVFEKIVTEQIKSLKR